jgi:hypothetical protein
MALEYIIYCDESEESGPFFSNFYGGALVRSVDLDSVREALEQRKLNLNLFGEVKWNKITENYANKYIDLLDTFFDLIASGKIKIRIMFTQNTNVAKNLTRRHIDEKYFILYYQFLKHAFGLHCSPVESGGVTLRIYPDQLPDTAEKAAQFRSYVVALGRTPQFRHRKISVKPENVSDVVSHEHVVLQCLDIVLGAMWFRLNDMHKAKVGPRKRGKRTKAKERVYNHINARIRAIYKNFNIGTSTARPTETSTWDHPYRHWLFVPKERIVIPKSKKKKKGTP